MPIRDEYKITRQGKEYILFAGLLDEAHNRGLVGMETEEIEVLYNPDDGQPERARYKATALMDQDGSICRYSGYGDADRQNVGRNIIPHLIRMAETRAKARALRDAINVGATALEELSDGDDAPPTENSGTTARSRPTPIRNARSRAEEDSDQISQAVEDNGQAEGAR